MKFTILLMLLVSITSSAFCAEAVTKDGKLTVLVPPGWTTFKPENPQADFGLVLQDQYPFTIFVTKENKQMERVISDIKAQNSEVEIKEFRTPSNIIGMRLRVREKLEKPNSFVYQYFYLVPSGKQTYAFICTSGVVMASADPKAVFDPIIQTISLK